MSASSGLAHSTAAGTTSLIQHALGGWVARNLLVAAVFPPSWLRNGDTGSEGDRTHKARKLKHINGRGDVNGDNRHKRNALLSRKEGTNPFAIAGRKKDDGAIATATTGTSKAVPRQSAHASTGTTVGNTDAGPTGRLWTRHLAAAGSAAAAAAVAVYALYPASLLLAFRISEQISWVKLFQRYHGCSTGTLIPDCGLLWTIQLSQLAATVGSLWYLAQLWRRGGVHLFGRALSRWTGLALYLVACATAVAVMKVGVDHVHLWNPPPGFDHHSALSGKVAVVTGANRGIGLATARWLASRGAHVVVTCRSLARCQPVVDEINAKVRQQQQELGGGNLDGENVKYGSASAAILDLSSLESAYNLVSQLTQEYGVPEERHGEESDDGTAPGTPERTSAGQGIHYIFCNAGTTPQRPLTKDGLEDAFGGMHLAHMAVVLGALPLLKRGAEIVGEDSRIVMVSSEMSINAAMGVFGDLDDMFDDSNLRGERMRGDGTLATSMPAYGRAKLCNVLLALELNRRLAGGGSTIKERLPIVAHAVHTGAVVTDSSRNSIKKIFEGPFPGLSWIVANIHFPLLWRNVEGGARTLLCAALSDQDFVVKGGQYLDALCHAFLPSATTAKDFTPEKKIRIPIGKGRVMSFFLDPVQALLVADAKYSSWLWNVSLDILKDSAAANVVKHAP
jgi:NAD(P)-dependent dehydrogenase (short-subunit alcohol dehydrogenase family)